MTSSARHSHKNPWWTLTRVSDLPVPLASNIKTRVGSLISPGLQQQTRNRGTYEKNIEDCVPGLSSVCTISWRRKYYNIVELPDCFPIHSTAGLIHSPSEYLCLLLTLTCTVPTALAILHAKNKENKHCSLLVLKILSNHSSGAQSIGTHELYW